MQQGLRSTSPSFKSRRQAAAQFQPASTADMGPTRTGRAVSQQQTRRDISHNNLALLEARLDDIQRSGEIREAVLDFVMPLNVGGKEAFRAFMNRVRGSVHPLAGHVETLETARCTLERKVIKNAGAPPSATAEARSVIAAMQAQIGVIKRMIPSEAPAIKTPPETDRSPARRAV